MKVFLTTSGPFPNGGANANRIKCYVKGLQNQCVDYEILTTSHRAKEDSSKGFVYKRIGLDCTDKTIFIRAMAFVYNTFLLRNYLRENVKKEDVVLIYHNGIVEDCILLSLKTQCILVRELCEIPYYDDRIVSRVMRWFQLHYFFKKFSGFIAISEPLKNLAERYKNKKAQVIKIPILIDKERFNNCLYNPFRKINGNYIFHSGSLSELKDGFIGMIEAIAEVNKRGYEIHLYSTGTITSDNDISRKIHSLGIKDKIHFLGFLQEQELYEYQRGSLLFIINKLDTLQNRYCFATKLGEYLSTRKAVIATNVGEMNYFLQDNKSAYIVESGSSVLIAKKIIEALNNSERRSEIGKGGYDVARNYFCHDFQGVRLYKFLVNLKKI